MSYVEVLSAMPHASPWLKLAIPWIGAQLNQLAGADPSAIAAEFAEAELLLRNGGRQAVFSDELAARMEALANWLDRWNSGEIGPGPCPPAGSQ
jgi:hypothetical protein